MAEQAAHLKLDEIKVGFRVLATDGHVGKVIEVLVGTPLEGSYLGIRLGGWFGKDLYLPVDHVRTVTEPNVMLDIPRRTLEAVATRGRPRAFGPGGGR
ncbi:MAG TPA: hypothetical protein VFC93_07475 [Chloroflexota bacterium]|nr:hypothetical protein [Chloroflexota bacterium]